MSTAIVIFLLLGFSICVVVGLVTVLQNLIHEIPVDLCQGALPPEHALVPDQSAEQ